tara:strand:- start:94 stop:510 length:417 start_codon:yes stop_codon:yes gene_type:complete
MGVENMKTTITIEGIDDKTSQAGKKYWSVHTDQGTMTVFENNIITDLRERLEKGQFCVVEMIENEKGFKNIRKIYADNADDNEVKNIKTERVADNKFVDARKAKDTSIYTSYVKDLVVAGKAVNEAIDLIKRAKEAFE